MASLPIPHLHKPVRILFSLILSFIVLTALFACNFVSPDKEEEEPENNATQIALGVQQTLLAQQNGSANATIAAQQATIQAQAALVTIQAQQPVVSQPTMPVVMETQPVLPVLPTVQAPAPAQPPQAPPPAQPPQSPPGGDFSEWMKTAQILLFEDVVADPMKSRYVKQTLDSMGLRYKDDGNAIGWLKNDLLSGSPTGKPWDLVILAIEQRGNVSGEYFEYLQEAIDTGASIIMEAWHLDAISEGKVSPILAKCGVQVYPYFPKNLDLTDVINYPYPAAAQHPIMNNPNKGLSFAKSLNTWLYTMDLGSKMAYTGHGDAIFLMGTSPQDDVKDATLATCLNGRLILQTFSSHSFSYKTIYPLWENYITNALQTRFAGG